MKKKYILTLTFLCILCGQWSYGFDNNEGNTDEFTTEDAWNAILDWQNISVVGTTPDGWIEFSNGDFFINGMLDEVNVISNGYSITTTWEDYQSMVSDNNEADFYSICVQFPEICTATTYDPPPPCNITSCPTGYDLINCGCVEVPCTITFCPIGYNLINCYCVKDPCDKNQQTAVKNQIIDPYLANSLSNVRASLQPPNTSIEKGFGVYKMTGGNNVASLIVQGSATNPQVTIGFGTSDPNYTPTAMLHSHPSGVYANPSAGDIYEFAGLYTSANTVTTSYVLAADGTTYAMVVTDATALATFLTTYPASTNQLDDSFKPGSAMQDLYQEAKESFINLGLSDDVAVERANAVIMAEAGINLLKAPANSTDFKQIQGTKTVDSNGSCTFTKSDCP